MVMPLQAEHELHRRRSGRNIGLALVLAAFVALVFGLSIAFAASSFFLSFFSFGGGALV